MKTTLAAFAAVLALPWSSSSAAPRLVVSTPSLAPESQIDFVLDRPVVAPDGLGKTVDNTWFEIKPAIPGKLVWKAQNIASLVPDQPPAIGTTYTFSIPKGKTHLDNTEVPAIITSHGSRDSNPRLPERTNRHLTRWSRTHSSQLRSHRYRQDSNGRSAS